MRMKWFNGILALAVFTFTAPKTSVAIAKDHGATVACTPSSSLRYTRLLLIDLTWTGKAYKKVMPISVLIIILKRPEQKQCIIFGEDAKLPPSVQGLLL